MRRESWKQLHDEACAREEDRYVDPSHGVYGFYPAFIMKNGASVVNRGVATVPSDS